MSSEDPESREIPNAELAAAFPPNFLWGAATSAYQIEGAVRQDGRGESIWDRFTHTPGRIRDSNTGDVACDHYRRWREDLDLATELGLRAYRFSIAWPRVFPQGTGPVNRVGLDFYRRLVDGLLDRGILPVITLYHWDLPQPLQDRGGWAERETAYLFAEYAGAVGKELGQLVPLWLTQNEPQVTAFHGHVSGVHAPGVRNWATAFAVSHHVLLSHGLAAAALRSAAGPEIRTGIALDLTPIEPLAGSSGDAAAARRMDGWRNRWFVDPVVLGRYPEDILDEHLRRWGPPSWLRDGDLETIAAGTDFLGVNFYSRSLVTTGGPNDFLEVRPGPPDLPVTAMGWEVVPQALTELLLRLRKEYGDLPIYITENGAAYDDTREGDSRFRDSQRIDYLRRHIAAMGRARSAGVDVRGYFVWTLMDNFEWAEGFTKRFGLIHVDFETQRRTLKDSARWYRDFIMARAHL